MKRRRQRSGFTLVEILIAMSVSVIVLGAMMILLVQSFRIWRDGTSWMYLTVQSRLAREKVLRGLDGQYGLRQASAKNVAVTQGSGSTSDRMTFSVDPNEWPTASMADDRVYTVEMDADKKLWAQGLSPLRLLRPDITTQVLDLSSSNQTVRAEIVVTVRNGGRSYTNRQVMQTFLFNP